MAQVTGVVGASEMRGVGGLGFLAVAIFGLGADVACFLRREAASVGDGGSSLSRVSAAPEMS